ncbi:hypothetical protein CEXT_521711 [Caerostris extrusa]|uniref:Uncharacterized protein n=1 Tax=Caerostris extrusa TaxID=172846 RepID=A0AAV4SVG9_CAEEX|nr:hypothetical protein CEXT_521711 [Caerostris extrusa]
MVHLGHDTELLKSPPYLCRGILQGWSPLVRMSFALRYSGETNDFPDSGIVRAYRIWHHFSCRISAAVAQPDAR